MSLKHLLGTELPIIQSPMAGAQGSALAVAVSNAGGLGSLACAVLSAERIRSELEIIRSQTNRPFNVNFFCHSPPVYSADREALWRSTLAPYFTELDLKPGEVAAEAPFLPVDAEMLDAIEAFRPAVVSFHFGLPSADLLGRVRSWGSRIISSATTVVEALWLETNGVDAVIAQGVEAGGHRGMFHTSDISTQIGTFALLPQIVRAVNIPVIAAGGITDARAVSAAMTLGASGVQVGTAYLLCPEATISPMHRAALKSEATRHTALTNVFTGRPARAIVNRLIREVGPVSDVAPAFPLALNLSAHLRAAAEERGSPEFSAHWCGQNATGCREISAFHLTRALATGL